MENQDHIAFLESELTRTDLSPRERSLIKCEIREYFNCLAILAEEQEEKEVIRDFLVLEDKVESGTATPEELNYYLSITHFDICDIEGNVNEVDGNW